MRSWYARYTIAWDYTVRPLAIMFLVLGVICGAPFFLLLLGVMKLDTWIDGKLKARMQRAELEENE